MFVEWLIWLVVALIMVLIILGGRVPNCCDNCTYFHGNHCDKCHEDTES